MIQEEDHCLSASPKDSSLRLLLTPVFSYKRNNLFIMEHAIAQMCTDSMMDTDLQFGLMFAKKLVSCLQEGLLDAFVYVHCWLCVHLVSDVPYAALVD